MINNPPIPLRKHMKVHGKDAVCQFDSSESDEEEELGSAASPSSSLVSAPPSYIPATSPSSSSHGQGVPVSQADWYFWICYMYGTLYYPCQTLNHPHHVQVLPPELPPYPSLRPPLSTRLATHPGTKRIENRSTPKSPQKSSNRLIWWTLTLKNCQRMFLQICLTSIDYNISFEDWLRFVVSGQIWGPPAQHRGDHRECLLTLTSFLCDSKQSKHIILQTAYSILNASG